MPVPEGPGIAISFDYLSPILFTPRGNTYNLLITDRVSRRADMFAVTAAKFTAEGTANILVNKYIPLLGCPRTILSDDGLQFCPKLSQDVNPLLGVRKLATSSYHQNGNGDVDQVNQTTIQVLAMVANERQDDWDLQLLHVECAHTTIRSARRRVWRPTWFTWVDIHVSLKRFLNAPESRDTRVWPLTTWPSKTWLQTDSSAPTKCFANTTPSPFLV